MCVSSEQVNAQRAEDEPTHRATSDGPVRQDGEEEKNKWRHRGIGRCASAMRLFAPTGLPV
jgi:hypothetical protein